jgi:hypothetical protein
MNRNKIEEKLLYTCQQFSVDYNQLEKNMSRKLFYEKIELLPVELVCSSLLRINFLDDIVSQRVPNVPSNFLSTKHRFLGPQSID